ncbi:MAG: DUF1175 family protein [Terriglobales bacterium]|jgi:uncharacterized protein YfaT (DUF1175 family)
MNAHKRTFGLLAAILAVSVAAVGGIWGHSVHSHTHSGTLRASIMPAALPADGFSVAELRLAGGSPPDLKISVVAGTHRLRIIRQTPEGALLRAGTLPGKATIEVSGNGYAPVHIELETKLDATDSAGDGTPDFLRLNDPADRTAFRRWFTLIAEAVYYRSANQLPTEINDCAALMRYAYREALREHTGEWATFLALPAITTASAVNKYSYPYTALEGAMFRVQPGTFRASDVSDGAFAEFADADSLRRFNSYFVSRELRRARAGDLLFFRQENQNMPFHAMIFLGHSQFEPGDDEFLIYHTGPNSNRQSTGVIHQKRLRSAAEAGEIRRLPLAELLRYPDARWRPLPRNSAFLGVYRWNILRGEE